MAVINKRLRRGPPKVRFDTIWGILILPSGAPLGAETNHAILAAGPDIALDIDPDTVGDARRHFCKDATLGELAVLADVEGADVMRPVRVMRRSRNRRCRAFSRRARKQGRSA